MAKTVFIFIIYKHTFLFSVSLIGTIYFQVTQLEKLVIFDLELFFIHFFLIAANSCLFYP